MDLKKRLLCIIALSLTVALILPAAVLAVPKVSQPQLVTGHQVTAGELVYQANCASCHGASAEGDFGPPIAGQSAAEITAALGSVAAMSGLDLTAQEINAVANFLQATAAPRIILTQPASGQFNAGAANNIGISVSSPASPVNSAEFQAFFDDPEGTFAAREITAQASISVPAPRAGAGAVATTISLPAGLPSASVVSVTISGTVTAVNADTGEWQIGTPPVLVYESDSTAFLGIPVPQAGDAVRIEALRTLATGPLVAKEITRLAVGALPASAVLMQLSILFNGTVRSIQPPTQSAGIKLGGETWTISGVPFRTDDVNSPAVIGPDLGQDSLVTVKFRTLPVGSTSNIALQIASQVSDVIPEPLHTNPQHNTEIPPPNLPAGTIRLFVIEGVVSEKNAGGEWIIGNQPITVYESAGTVISAAVPVEGDEVLVIARRTVEAGPLVADSINRQTAGPLTVGPAVVERTLIFNGTVETTASDAWTIGGASFVINDSVSPTAIGTGLSAGSAVTVEFKTNLPATPDEDLWAPFDFNPAISTGSATLTPPSVTVSRPGFVFLRAENDDQQVTTIAVPATLLTAAPPPPPPATDGGGGGGGGPVTLTFSLSGLSGTLTVNSAGTVQSTAKLTGTDGKVIFDIPAGTTLKTASGNPITSITMAVPDTIPAAPSGKTIVFARNFGPDGATFDPPITLSLTYEESTLPAGVQENDLVIAFWDGAEWVILESTVNAEADTVSAQVSHFTMFGILAQLPASTPTPTPTTPATPTTPTTPTTPPVTPEPPITTPTPVTPSPSVPSSEPAPTPEASPAGPNWGLIIGITAAIVVVAGLGVFMVRRRVSK